MLEYSIACFEMKSIAKGVEAADIALKSANVKLVSAQPVCPGKYEIFLAGPLADVKAASDRLDNQFGEFIIDSIQIGRIDQSVAKALLGALPQPKLDALGIIETFTASSAIMAADAAVKSACVSIVELRIARGMGGKGYVSFTGAAADAKAALEAGSAAAKSQGTFVASSFIAAPHIELWNLI
jgi:microcompartment protein CcmL/EutN